MTVWKVKKTSTILTFLIFVIICENSYAQKNEVNFIFDKIEQGFNQRDVNFFSNYLSNRTYIRLSDGNSGHFSGNQSFYVLKRYFEDMNLSEFTYENLFQDSDNPYASGKVSYLKKGKRGALRVFILLENLYNSWKITQITINEI